MRWTWIFALAAMSIAATLPGSAQAIDLTSYNLVVLGDYSSQYSDVEGRAAVGGNVTLTGFSVGSKLGNAPTGVTLVVGGNLNYSGGSVNGSVAVGGTTSGNVTVNNGTMTTGSSGVDFSALSVQLKDLSTTLAALQTNGVTADQYGGLTLTGTSSTLNVFTIDGSQLSSANGLVINVPAGSQVLINVSGTVDQMANFQITVNGTTSSLVLYNFYQATSLTLSGISVQGSVLAANAATVFSNGNLNGILLTGSLSGSGELHDTGYAGTLLTTTSAVPEPTGWVTLIIGFGVIGTIIRRRRFQIPGEI